MLSAPVVRIVSDLRIPVDCHGVAFHDPFDGRLAVHLPIVGAWRDVEDPDLVIVDDDAPDLFAKRIYRKQLNGTGRSKVVIAAPKSRTSARDIPLAPILLPVLERLRQEDAEAYFIGGRMKCSEVRTYREFYDRFLARIRKWRKSANASRA